MPTGYTAGIIDGKITTFEQFATQCSRAFGATIHMRDNPLDSPYEPRTPSEYYVNSLQSQREKLEETKTMTDEAIVQDFETLLKDSLEYHERELEKTKVNLGRLNSIMESAKSWVPPTEDHEGVRDYMIDQLEITIKADGDPSYHVNKIVQAKKELEEGIDPKVYREEKIKEIEDRISYYEGEVQKELERCKQSNDWMDKFLESIKK
jgi:hypothetical protein